MMQYSSRSLRYASVLGAAVLALPASLHANEHTAMDALEPVLSSVTDLRLKGSFGAEFGASSANRNRNGAGNTESFHTFNISHVRFGAEATVYDDFHLDATVSLLPTFGNVIHDLGGEGAGVNLYHATLSYTGFEVTDLTFGYMFPRFGLEAYADDEDLITITRTVLSGLVRPFQHTGLAAHGDWDIFNYHLGLYNGDAGGGTNPSQQYPVGYLFNVSGGVDLDEVAAKLHEDLSADLRVDFLYNDEAGTGVGGELFKNAVAIGTNVSFMGIDVTYEYMWARATNNLGLGVRPKVHGYYIMPSYFVTDRFQAVARYERMRNTEGNVIGGAFSHNVYAADIAGISSSGNKYQAFYLGGNYYLHGNNVKLMGGLELAELRDTAAANFQSRTHTAMTALRMQF